MNATQRLRARTRPATRRGRHLLGRLALCSLLGASAQALASTYDELLGLFEEWRALEQPALRDGAPDYTPTAISRRYEGMLTLRERLRAMDTSAWSVDEKIDWHLVRAEMNALDFYTRVLKPWSRDPTFYASVRTAQSDTPAEEAPTIHNAVRLWEYSLWPRTALSRPSALSVEAEQALAGELRTIAPLLEQARGNLTGNARDLWVPSPISSAIRRRPCVSSGSVSRAPAPMSSLHSARPSRPPARSANGWRERRRRRQAPRASRARSTPGTCATYSW